MKRQIPSAFAEEASQVTASTGTLKLPVFVVDFQDVTFASNRESAQNLTKQIFEGDGSVAEYYNRSSYGQLQLSGDVFEYTAKNPIADYENEDGYENLVMEVLNAFDVEVDYSQYDQNQDGILDAFVISIPTGGDEQFWYGCQATWYQNMDFQVDGVTPHNYVMNDAQPYADQASYYNEVLQHELGHCMGLPDYYKYNDEEDYDGLHGMAGLETMDDMEGDFSMFSKLQLGWLKEDQVQVMQPQSGEEEFLLPSASQGGCLLIYPEGQQMDTQGEYFVVEYDTPEGNLSGLFTGAEAGVRIFKVDAEMTKEYGETLVYRYNNYGADYDSSNKGRRVIKLVNDGEGFYHTGDTVAYGCTNFGWYSEDGTKVTDPGITITIGKVTADGIDIDITRQ